MNGEVSAEAADKVVIEAPPNPAADKFFAGAEARVLRVVWVLAGLGTMVLAVRYGGAVAFGFVLGAAAAVVNFLWLKRVVAGFAATVVNEAKRPSSARLVFRYLVRFALITFVAFAIFKGSRPSGYGFLAGLFLPVGALMCEAAYEAWMAVRRGF